MVNINATEQTLHHWLLSCSHSKYIKKKWWYIYIYIEWTVASLVIVTIKHKTEMTVKEGIWSCMGRKKKQKQKDKEKQKWYKVCKMFSFSLFVCVWIKRYEYICIYNTPIHVHEWTGLYVQGGTYLRLCLWINEKWGSNWQ